MKVSKNHYKKALIFVDVQGSFLNKRNIYIVKNILKLLDSTKYDAYVEVSFYAPKGSLWEKQQKWICPAGEDTKVIEAISKTLKPYKPLKILKKTRSAFKGNKELATFLKNKRIREVHIVGLDTEDCVLATAFEAFDLGFLTYVLEECVQSFHSNDSHQMALKLLRKQNMTNNSYV